MIWIACVFYMVMPTEVFHYIDRIIYGEWPGKPGDKLTEALNLFAIASSVLLFWWGTRRARYTQFNRALPLAVAGLLVISALWSVTPSTTITRSVAYFFLVLGAIGTVEIFEPDQVMRLTALIGGFSAAISLVLPDAAYAITGAFRGPFPGKNQLGAAMAIGVLGALHSMRVARRRRFIYIGGTLLCAIVAFLSKSGTSLLVIFAFFIFHLTGTFYIKGGISRIASMCFALFATGAFIFLMFNIDFIYGLLDKDPTLTGRTDIWAYVIDSIYQRPLLGWGFAAFWMESNPSAVAIFSNLRFVFNEAHNGILQLLLDVGLLGTAFFLFLWMRNVATAVKCINGPAPAIGVSSLTLLMGILLMGVTEQVLTTADVWTAQFFMLGFMCEKELGIARQGGAAIVSRSTVASLGQLVGSREGDAA
jgi:O-antigen ligase